VKKIAVLTSGGDAPGMNACIRSVIRACAHYNLEVFGIHRGYQGLIENEIHPMTTSSVANIIQMGGTILKTARSMDFMTPEGRKKAHQNLVNLGIEGIVCIGGNGTYTGAMIFEKEFGIPSMVVPAQSTMIFGEQMPPLVTILQSIQPWKPSTKSEIPPMHTTESSLWK
jgi:6-phosphofructokinase 1